MAHPRAVEAPVSTPESAVVSVQCDLCESPMSLPRQCGTQGVILGLLVCPQCVEDELAARKLTYQPEAHA